MNQIQVPTSTIPSWVHLATVFMVPLSVHVTLLTHYSLDTSYCAPFRTLNITHSSVFLVDHSISRISTQQWISRNLFTFGPMLMGTFLLNQGWGITRRSLWHRFWDTLYRCTPLFIHIISSCTNSVTEAALPNNLRTDQRSRCGQLYKFLTIFRPKLLL